MKLGPGRSVPLETAAAVRLVEADGVTTAVEEGAADTVAAVVDVVAAVAAVVVAAAVGDRSGSGLRGTAVDLTRRF